MGKIKVKIDPPSVPREIIKKHKNFDRFMDRYRKYYSTSGIRRLLYKDRRTMAMIVIIVILLLLLLFNEI